MGENIQIWDLDFRRIIRISKFARPTPNTLNAGPLIPGFYHFSKFLVVFDKIFDLLTAEGRQQIKNFVENDQKFWKMVHAIEGVRYRETSISAKNKVWRKMPEKNNFRKKQGFAKNCGYPVFVLTRKLVEPPPRAPFAHPAFEFCHRFFRHLKLTLRRDK